MKSFVLSIGQRMHINTGKCEHETSVCGKKTSSTSGTQIHNLLVPGKLHYYCATRQLQLVGNRNEFLSNMTPKQAIS